jgi:nucleotide-binding universal stress UspA family protein
MSARSRRIAVGFDGSPGGFRALETAVELMGYGSTLTVVGMEGQGRSPGDVLDAARDLLLARLMTARYVQGSGDRGRALVDAAAEVGADLIVIGRDTDAEALDADSLVAEVVRLARCDVLVAA